MPKLRANATQVKTPEIRSSDIRWKLTESTSRLRQPCAECTQFQQRELGSESQLQKHGSIEHARNIETLKLWKTWRYVSCWYVGHERKLLVMWSEEKRTLEFRSQPSKFSHFAASRDAMHYASPCVRKSRTRNHAWHTHTCNAHEAIWVLTKELCLKTTMQKAQSEKNRCAVYSAEKQINAASLLPTCCYLWYPCTFTSTVHACVHTHTHAHIWYTWALLAIATCSGQHNRRTKKGEYQETSISSQESCLISQRHGDIDPLNTLSFCTEMFVPFASTSRCSASGCLEPRNVRFPQWYQLLNVLEKSWRAIVCHVASRQCMIKQKTTKIQIKVRTASRAPKASEDQTNVGH